MNDPFDNPVFSLDSRSRVREKRLWILALFFLAVPLAISLLVLFQMVKPDASPFPDAGDMFSFVAVFSHGALLVLLSALGAAQRISQERERRTLPALVNSPMSAARIADGKLLGAWRFAAWLAVLTLPFLAVATLWGGLPAWKLLAAWALNLAAALATASLALGFSGLLGRSLSAYLATGAVLFLWCFVLPVVGVIVAASSDVSTPAGEAAILSAFVYHLPVVPQLALLSDGFDGDLPHAGLVYPVALSVWFLLGLLGRTLAVRGLRREVY